MNTTEELTPVGIENILIKSEMLQKESYMKDLCIDMKNQTIELLNQHADYIKCVGAGTSD